MIGRVLAGPRIAGLSSSNSNRSRGKYMPLIRSPPGGRERPLDELDVVRLGVKAPNPRRRPYPTLAGERGPRRECCQGGDPCLMRLYCTRTNPGECCAHDSYLVPWVRPGLCSGQRLVATSAWAARRRRSLTAGRSPITSWTSRVIAAVSRAPSGRRGILTVPPLISSSVRSSFL